MGDQLGDLRSAEMQLMDALPKMELQPPTLS
jgi:hypothetical protein